jgi:hypothetical protein
MSPERRKDLRSIMLIAWDFRRAGPERTFADCLRGAWAWTRRMAADTRAFMARMKGRRIDFAPSLIRSPIANTNRGRRYGGVADHKAAYLTSRLGS